MTDLPQPIPALRTLHRVREPGDQPDLVRLNRNERQAPLPQWFVDKIASSVTSSLLTGYPITDDLYRRLSLHLGVEQEQLLLTAGSDAAVKAVYQAYVSPGDTVVMLSPSYAMYEVYAEMFQARTRHVRFNERLELDEEELLGCLTEGVRLVMIANPNQPTGTVMRQQLLLDLLERSANMGAILAVDEAYYPFSGATVLPLVSQYPNLLVLRTFSKAAGLAALRIGYAAGHAEIIGNMFKVRSVHDINSIAILAASELLSHPEIVDDYVTQVQEGKRFLEEKVRDLGLEPLPTCTNFMQIRVGSRCSPAELVERLCQNGYLVRGPSALPCLGDCIRVTLGSPDVMAGFVRVLTETLKELGRNAND